MGRGRKRSRVKSSVIFILQPDTQTSWISAGGVSGMVPFPLSNVRLPWTRRRSQKDVSDFERFGRTTRLFAPPFFRLPNATGKLPPRRSRGFRHPFPVFQALGRGRENLPFEWRGFHTSHRSWVGWIFFFTSRKGQRYVYDWKGRSK